MLPGHAPGLSEHSSISENMTSSKHVTEDTQIEATRLTNQRKAIGSFEGNLRQLTVPIWWNLDADKKSKTSQTGSWIKIVGSNDILVRFEDNLL